MFYSVSVLLCTPMPKGGLQWVSVSKTTQSPRLFSTYNLVLTTLYNGCSASAPAFVLPHGQPWINSLSFDKERDRVEGKVGRKCVHQSLPLSTVPSLLSRGTSQEPHLWDHSHSR